MGKDNAVRIKWWGHASFLITAQDGTRILTDPYNNEVGYKKITDEADIVTVSHGHFDHNAVNLLPGNPEVVRDTAGIAREKVEIRGVASYHDQQGGASRGENIIYIIEVDGLRICHLGDLGHVLEEKQIAAIGRVDILLVPVGGIFTIDAASAYEVCQQLNPAVIIPMHYKTRVLKFNLKGVDEFLNKFFPGQVKRPGQAEVEITSLPEEQTIYVLDYAG